MGHANVGAALYVASSILDHADGELAHDRQDVGLRRRVRSPRTSS
jgi:hypothetical protein